MKFGGTSVADAARLRAVADVVAGRGTERVVVVVSALAGVTDLLVRAVAAARGGDLERLDTLVADVERRNRWALDAVEAPGARHDLALEVAALFEELRGRLRSIRVLGEATQRVVDPVLAVGDTLAARIAAAVLRDRGVPAEWVDAREAIVAAPPFGAGRPDVQAVRRRCGTRLVPALNEGRLPVLAGFVAVTPEGDSITLGRGGSDTTAAVLGLALDAEEIQIWTDVDGVMTADPRIVPAARTLERVTFAEAAQIAFLGAKVLHPASIAPAVARSIPVRVLNSLSPGGGGTIVEAEARAGEPRNLAAVTHRSPVVLLRVEDTGLRGDPALAGTTLAALGRRGIAPCLVACGECGVAVALPSGSDCRGLGRDLPEGTTVEAVEGRSMISVVGRGLRDAAQRARVLGTLVARGPEALAWGPSGIAVSAIFSESGLDEALRGIHRELFEGGAA